MTSFKGLGVAMVTPFDENGEIDYESLAHLIDYDIEGGVDYIVALGTTAETPTLSADERHRLRRFFVDRVAGRVPLVVGCGGNSTAGVVSELASDDLEGFSAILSVVPYYNKPAQAGLYAHFAAIAEASPLPVILYNIPSRTGVNMLPETTLRLAADFKGKIVGVKEASGIMGQIGRVSYGRAGIDDFVVLSGDDSLTLPLIAIGCDGVVSVAANALPRQMKRLVSLAMEGDMAGARRQHIALASIFRLLFVDGNPAGIKALLSLQGLTGPTLRLPLVNVTEPTRQALAQALLSLEED